MFDFNDRVVIVTGAVGNLGLATAKAFQRAGARTALVDRSPDRLKRAYAEVANPHDHFLAGDGGFGAYSASKSAVLRLSESLADELKPAGINVNCVLPGTIDTPQNRQERPSADHGKWVEPAAIADVILFLASDAARAVNGAAVPVFGKA